MKQHSKYCIIGAGLSGLTTAYKLLQNGETNFTVLEARERVGGRLFTLKDIDFGAAWLQNYHSNLLTLIGDLGLKTVSQYTTGKSVLMYNTMATPHYFETDPNASSAFRIAGGSLALIEALSKKVSDKIILNTKVEKLSAIGQNIIITSNNGTFSAEKTIITLPPKLASTIVYNPELPEHLQRVMETTHTWMSNAIKVGIHYKTPFWKTKGFSGTMIGQTAPVVEIYDHSNYNNSVFALMGFVNENLRAISTNDRKAKIIKYLTKHLGSEAQNYSNYLEKDWSKDGFTSIKTLNSYHLTPKYGDPVFDSFYLMKNLLFSGTETAPQYGGYMEGAVISGLITAEKLLHKTKKITT